VVGQANGLLARYATAVSAALVLGVTKVVGTALLQTRSVQRGDVVKVADRTLARLIYPPLVQTTAITLRKKNKTKLFKPRLPRVPITKLAKYAVFGYYYYY